MRSECPGVSTHKPRVVQGLNVEYLDSEYPSKPVIELHSQDHFTLVSSQIGFLATD